MHAKPLLLLAGVGLLSTWTTAPRVGAEEPTRAQTAPPEVPQRVTLKGPYIRAAYNREGYVILGFRFANASIDEAWMILDVGLALLDGVPDYSLNREGLSLTTPDGQTIPLASISEYRKANLRAMENRALIYAQADSIDYFPRNAFRACQVRFFSREDDPGFARAGFARDRLDLSDQLGCQGRLYFEVPGGIAYGNYWLNVKFEKSTVRVPFRILTKEEDELLNKNFGEIKKQVDGAFKKKK